MTRSCAECTYYNATRPATAGFPSEGQCRVRSVTADWPPRRGDDWCGEFRPPGGPIVPKEAADTGATVKVKKAKP